MFWEPEASARNACRACRRFGLPFQVIRISKRRLPDFKKGMGQALALAWRRHAVKDSRGPGQVEEWVRDGLEKEYPGIRLAKV